MLVACPCRYDPCTIQPHQVLVVGSTCNIAYNERLYHLINNNYTVCFVLVFPFVVVKPIQTSLDKSSTYIDTAYTFPKEKPEGCLVYVNL